MGCPPHGRLVAPPVRIGVGKGIPGISVTPGLPVADRAGVVADPCRNFGLAKLAGRHREDDAHLVDLVGSKLEAVYMQEHSGAEQPGALVTIDKGVVADDTEAVGGRQLREAGLRPIGETLAGPSERTLEQRLIAYSLGTAEVRERFVVKGYCDVAGQPPGLIHLASSRIALRCRRIYSRPASTASAKSGS